MHLRKTMLTFGYAEKYPKCFIGASVRTMSCCAWLKPTLHIALYAFLPPFQAAFFIVFFITRIFIGLWATAIWWVDILTLVQSGQQHSMLVVGFMMAANAIMNSMNLFWFWQMLQVFFNGVGLKSIAKADEKQH